MIPLAISDAVTTAPLAFVLGVGVGLLLSSRYFIIRRRNGEGAPPP